MNSQISSASSLSTNHLKKLSPENLLQKIFEKFDANKDGHLSLFEFNEALKNLSRVTGAAYPKKADIEALFHLIDINGDEKISKSEYMKLTVSIANIFDDYRY